MTQEAADEDEDDDDGDERKVAKWPDGLPPQNGSSVISVQLLLRVLTRRSDRDGLLCGPTQDGRSRPLC